MFSEVAESNRGAYSDRGNAAVEMALLLPFLCLFLSGVMELSILIHNQAVITNASREGARYGIAAVGGPHTDTAIKQWVGSYVKDRLISFSPSATVTTITRGGSTPGSVLRGGVAYPYSFLALPNLAYDFDSALTLGAETTMRLE